VGDDERVRGVLKGARRLRGPTDLRARRAGEGDVDGVHALLAAAGRSLARQGFGNWDPPYPIERLRADVRERDVYVVHDHVIDEGGAPVATFTLAPIPTRPYEPEPWLERGVLALYLNRLAVDPLLQGRGVGGWCLARVEALAREAGAAAVRCDVLAANVALRASYERRGYVARGERAHSGWTFACYELTLDSV
jgi:GNAT superfamily N-acetyltransferase